MFLRFPKWVQIKSSLLKLGVVVYVFKPSSREAGTYRWILNSKVSLYYTVRSRLIEGSVLN